MLPHLEETFRDFVPVRDALLLELEEEAERENIPIVGPVVGELLFILARAMGAKRILELGTATGYSAIHLAKACEETGGQLITLEHDGAMAARARVNLERAGLGGHAEVRVGDALEELTKMKGPFDLIFLDIDKEVYLPVLSSCHRLFRKKGLLIADNVGFKGTADFNRVIAESPQWRAVHLLCLLPLHSPERDGLCLALCV
jgi:predicted O-methyltransferase YrrM